MLGELEADGKVIVSDLEAGLGTLLRMERGHADVVLVIAEPSAKSIETARRAAEIASERAGVIVVANRVRDDSDLDAITSALAGHEVAVVPEDPAITRADRQGLAPLDADPAAPGVEAITGIAQRLEKDVRPTAPTPAAPGATSPLPLAGRPPAPPGRPGD